MGTLEKGKLANLVLFDGPAFAEDSSVRFVFVEGTKYEMDKKKKKENKEQNEKE